MVLSAHCTMKLNKKLSRPATNASLLKATMFVILFALGMTLLGYVYLDRRLNASEDSMSVMINQIQPASEVVEPAIQPKTSNNYPQTPEELSCDELSSVPLAYAFTFIGYEPIGAVTLNGKIVKKTIREPWGPEDATVDKIFYEVTTATTDNQQLFVDHYKRMAEEGNTINLVENQKLLFGLGSNKGGTEFVTTADVEPEDWKKIISYANTGKTMQLSLTISTHRVSEVGSDFIIACRVATE